MTVRPFDLASIAPRLALARDQVVAERAAFAKAEAAYQKRKLQLEWLIAHRELQLARGGFTRDRRYIAWRTRKLETARRELADLQPPPKPASLR